MAKSISSGNDAEHEKLMQDFFQDDASPKKVEVIEWDVHNQATFSFDRWHGQNIVGPARVTIVVSHCTEDELETSNKRALENAQPKDPINRD